MPPWWVVFLILLFLILFLRAIGKWLANRKRKRQQDALRKREEEERKRQKEASPGQQRPEYKPPAGSVFISYRRQDSQHVTDRIYDSLSNKLGKGSVVKDVDAIRIGEDFRVAIQKKISQCSVLVAVIGQNWNPAAASGSPRLADPRDHLRIELETALKEGKPVIPVLVDGAAMPAEENLPPSLANLPYLNAAPVRPDPDFHNDVERLLRGIESHLNC